MQSTEQYLPVVLVDYKCNVYIALYLCNSTKVENHHCMAEPTWYQECALFTGFTKIVMILEFGSSAWALSGVNLLSK